MRPKLGSSKSPPWGEAPANWTADDLGDPVPMPAVQSLPSDWVLDDIAALVPKVTVRLPHPDDPRRHHDSTAALAKIGPDDVDGPRRRQHLRGRIPGSMLLVEAWVDTWLGQDIAHLTLSIVCSDQSSREFNQPVGGIILELGEPVVFHHGARAVAAPPVNIGGRWVTALAGATTIGDGQAPSWVLSILCTPKDVAKLALPESAPRLQTLYAEFTAPLRYGLFTGWGTADYPLPTFGLRPEVPSFQPFPGEADTWPAYLRERGDLWDLPPWGCAKNPGQTGNQQDFGAVKGNGAWYDPRLIDKLYFSALAEGKRPYHYREPDGSPYTKAAHPDCWMWDQRPDGRFSPDQLGKDNALIWGRITNGWTGYDRQHLSINNHYAAALLTGCPLLRRWLDDHAEVYLSSDTVPSEVGDRSTNGMDAARAVGRTFTAMCQVHLLTGRDDVLTRMHKRLHECVAVQWQGAKYQNDPARTWRPLAITGDPRVFWVVDPAQPQNYSPWSAFSPELPWPLWSLPHYAIMSWQEGLGVMGLWSLWRTGGDPLARDICAQVARTFVEACYAQDAQGRWHMGYVKWDDGLPHPEWANIDAAFGAKYAKPWGEHFIGSETFFTNKGFEDWGVPALKILRRINQEDGVPTDRVDAILAAHAGGQPREWDTSCWRAVD